MRAIGIYLIVQSTMILFKALGLISLGWSWVTSVTWVPAYLLILAVGFGCLFFDKKKEKWEEE